MIPHFDPPFTAEKIRDGGSLALCFQSAGQSFWLFFPIVHQYPHNGEQYRSPLVINRTLNQEEPISWENAASWLSRALEELTDDSSRKWAAIMLEVAQHQGHYPKELPPYI